jgi:hypothetical protein
MLRVRYGVPDLPFKFVKVWSGIREALDFFSKEQ